MVEIFVIVIGGVVGVILLTLWETLKRLLNKKRNESLPSPKKR